MKSVQEIAKAAENLKPEEFLLLRKKLERIEKKLWETELARTARELRKRGIKDSDIDRMVAKRRRESRR